MLQVRGHRRGIPEQANAMHMYPTYPRWGRSCMMRNVTWDLETFLESFVISFVSLSSKYEAVKMLSVDLRTESGPRDLHLNLHLDLYFSPIVLGTILMLSLPQHFE